MSVALKQHSFPALQPVALPGVDSDESISQWTAVLSRALHTDIVRRSGALLTFLLAVLMVMLVAGGALAQADSDNDGLSDGAESSVHGTDPNNGDSDLDGLPDGVEVSLGTNPLAADSDGDGASDAEEYLSGDDPLVAALVPVVVVVTPVPTSVVSGSNSAGVTTSAVAQTPATVSPEAVDGEVVPESLAFNDSIWSDRSPLFALYVLIAVGIGVGMFDLLSRIPEVE